MIRLKHILNEETITPGSKEYFKKEMSDDEILNLADKLSKYPYTRVKKPSEVDRYFRDLAHLLAFPSDPIETMTYVDGKGYVDQNKIKMKPSEARLFQMYKSGKLDMKQYGEIQKPLMLRYIQLAKKFASGLNYSKGI